MTPEYVTKDSIFDILYCGFCNYSDETKQVLNDIIEQVRAIPATDVVPVRYGCWIADKEDVEWGNYLIHYRCSECKERPHFDKDKYKFILSSYCPNCGARMVKEITYG